MKKQGRWKYFLKLEKYGYSGVSLLLFCICKNIIFIGGMKMKHLYIVFFMVLLLSFIGCGEKKVTLQNSEDDTQPYWNIYNQSVAAAEGGYYYLKDVTYPSFFTYIKYMDAQTRQTTLLCNKAECQHKDSSCNAFVDKFNYNQMSIYYYKNFVYMIKNNESDGNSYLIQITPDGSQRKEMFEIGALNVAYKLAFGGDAVYIYNRVGGNGIEPTTETVRRRSLDGKEDEIVYSYTDTGAQISAVKLYGDKAFILVKKCARDSSGGREFQGKGVFVYDRNTKETIPLLEYNVTDFTVNTDNGNIYFYVLDEGLYSQPLSGGKRKKIYDCEEGLNNLSEISTDGQYLYINNGMYKNMLYKIDSYVWVLDFDGNVKNKIKAPTKAPLSALFGDDKYLFDPLDSGNESLYVIPKSEITTAQEWQKVE